MRGWKSALILVLVLGAAIGIGSLAQVGYAAPTGPEAVARTTLRWTDDARDEPMTADPSDHREVVAHVWYPTASGGNAQRRSPRAPRRGPARRFPDRPSNPSAGLPPERHLESWEAPIGLEGLRVERLADADDVAARIGHQELADAVRHVPEGTDARDAARRNAAQGPLQPGPKVRVERIDVVDQT